MDGPPHVIPLSVCVSVCLSINVSPSYISVPMGLILMKLGKCVGIKSNVLNYQGNWFSYDVIWTPFSSAIIYISL